MVVRKRRSTFNDRFAERKKRTSSPLKPAFNRAARPSDDYVLKEVILNKNFIIKQHEKRNKMKNFVPKIL
jgi:hypothetical protein